jgi:gas vesicle protein
MLDGAAQAITGEDLDNPEDRSSPVIFNSKTYRSGESGKGEFVMHEKRVIIKRGGSGSLLSGFLIGGLIGATVALLSAPQSGSETRARLGDKANELKDRAGEKAGELKDRATSMASDVSDRASKVASSARDQASDMTKKVTHRGSDMMEDVSKKTRDIGESASSSINPRY